MMISKSNRFLAKPISFRSLSIYQSRKEPFYGHPRRRTNPNDPPFMGSSKVLPLLTQLIPPAPSSSTASTAQWFQSLLHHSATAFVNPTRADAVAAVGELTGATAAKRLLETMEQNPVGREILRDRPLVEKKNIPYERLIREAQSMSDDPNKVTFGQAYGKYLSTHDFDPDARDDVRHLDPALPSYENLRYVILRQRQCHDFWHALTDLPPTVAGELALKWLELLQTGFPVAALSSTVGSGRLLLTNPVEFRVLLTDYLPWAVDVHERMQFGDLMNVYYEREWDTPLEELRSRIGVTPAPKVLSDVVQ